MTSSLLVITPTYDERDNLERFADALFAVLVHGPRFVTRFWLELDPPASTALYAVYAGLVLLASAGLVAAVARDPARRRLIFVLAGVAIVGAAAGAGLAIRRALRRRRSR